MSNPVPEGWSSAELATFCDVVGGGTPDRSVGEYWGGEIPWVSPSEITSRTSKYISGTKEYITQFGLDKSSAKLHPPGTVLMTSRASIGYVAINTVPMTTNQGFQSLRCKDDVLAEYLYQYITWIRGELEKVSAGSTFAEISSSNVRKIRVTLPPLPEQEKIAAILSTVDDVIEKTRAQIDKLKDLKTGMMQELLTKGIGHTEFKDSPVGRIPVGWDVGTIDSFDIEVLDGDRGSEYPKEKDFYQWEHCLFLSAKNVTKRGFVFEEKMFLIKDKDDALRKGKLIRGDIVITTRGTVGNIAYYGDDVPYAHIRINSGMAIIRNGSEKVIPEYLHLLMNAPVLREQIELLAFGSAQPQLTIGIIKGLYLPMPSGHEQKQIASVVRSVESKLELANDRFNQFEKIKKALMQDLLTGKVRVKLDNNNLEGRVAV
ncbi:restriction endonuclease subunit S [Methylophaga sp. OBS3]|uniref:restriction endonuclease subunit S n=1 Tax=Methylophaga sp. OBS3 TaxID=2991934 RepID=UPI002251FF24|nr:restriction endonuclease subunit S [Methylophaga sp. OBS3]MCX4190812.1 restriction endonuclease subunit S [Methylophaga sp. OBS3]